MRKFWLKSLMLTGTALLVACEVGPDYTPPPVEAPPVYKEGANWAPANPEDAINRGAWWSIYQDPVLDNLEKQVDISNQNLKEAEAAWRVARAEVEESRSQLFPTISANGSGIRSGGGSKTAGGGGPATAYNLSAGASWVPDLWGKIRREVESSEATAQASAADVALARLTAQAELASDYYSLRGEDELKYLLDATTVADQKALKIVENQYKVGVAAQADVLTARTQLESVQAQDINTGVLRTQYEHAIAVLTGKPPAELTIVPAPLAEKVPVVPAGLPSALLQRRPDIAAAERQMASANAEIGVAVSAYYPNLGLSASYGYAGTQLGQLFQGPFSLWSFGPSIAETIFDAGLRDAQVEAARATYDQQVAAYRQTVLTGFQQVEDELSALHVLQEQAKMETSVVNDAKKAQQLTMNQYQTGTVPYSSVLTAQVTTLSNEQTALTVRQNRFIASVALIEALGGGWDTSQLPVGSEPAAASGEKLEQAPAPVPAPVSEVTPAPAAAPGDNETEGTISNINTTNSGYSAFR